MKDDVINTIDDDYRLLNQKNQRFDTINLSNLVYPLLNKTSSIKDFFIQKPTFPKTGSFITKCRLLIYDT